MVTIKVYTNDVILDISSRYKAAPTAETVAAVAAQLGVSERSVIAKLASLNIYEKKPYLTKQGVRPISKEVYIDRISKMLGIDITMLDSMEKVTKQGLVLLSERIQALIDE